MSRSLPRRKDKVKRSKRTLVVVVRMSPEEKVAFMDLAEKLGTDLSELLRQLAHRELREQQKKAAA